MRWNGKSITATTFQFLIVIFRCAFSHEEHTENNADTSEHLRPISTPAAETYVSVDFGIVSHLPSLTRKVQAYNSGLVTMTRLARDAHLLPRVGASFLRIDVGLGWDSSVKRVYQLALRTHMPGILGNVISDFDLSSFSFDPILKLSEMLNQYRVTPIYSWCYNPFDADFTKPVTNLTEWSELHRLISFNMRKHNLPAIHELYNEPDLPWAFTGSWEQYQAMAAAAAKGLKAGDPNCTIIGPAAAVPTPERLAGLLQLVKSGQLPLNGLSVHAYGAGAWQTNVEILKAALEKASVKLPIHLNEVNVETDPAQLNSYALAASIFSTIHELLEHEEVTMANWAQLMESGAGDSWGVVTEEGFLKPAFHAFYLYARMPQSRTQLMMTSGNAWIQGFASSNATVATAAVWTTSLEATDVTLSMQGFPFKGPTQLEVYIIDPTHNHGTTAQFIRPSQVLTFAAQDTVRWQGILEPRASLFFEVSPTK